MRQEVIIIVRNYQLIIGNQIFFFDGWGKIFKTYKSRRIFLR